MRFCPVRLRPHLGDTDRDSDTDTQTNTHLLFLVAHELDHSIREVDALCPPRRRRCCLRQFIRHAPLRGCDLSYEPTPSGRQSGLKSHASRNRDPCTFRLHPCFLAVFSRTAPHAPTSRKRCAAVSLLKLSRLPPPLHVSPPPTTRARSMCAQHLKEPTWPRAHTPQRSLTGSLSRDVSCSFIPEPSLRLFFSLEV